MKLSNDSQYGFQIISKGIRFGYGFRTVDGKKQHFAYFGKPSQNDDYYVNVEISEEEYTKLCMDYPNEIHNCPSEIANTFRETYIVGHSVILEGWNKIL